MARPTLPHPPSDRYANPTGGEVAGPNEAGTQSSDADATAPGRWAEVGAVLVAIVTAVVLIVLGGVLGLTTGLLFVAGVGGAFIGLLLASSSRRESRLSAVAIGLGVAAVVVGAIGSWLIALQEGGALGLVDYTWATSGLLVPVEAVVASLASIWGVRTGPIRD